MDITFKNPATSDRFYFCVTANHYQCAMKHEVLYLEATEKGYVLIHMENGEKYMLSTNLGNVAQQFDGDEFIRISRRHLVNRAKITAIKGTEVILGLKRLDMSKSGSQRLFSRIPVLRTAQWKVFSHDDQAVRAV